MLYDELQQRYGNHIAKLVKNGLSHSEFHALTVDKLPHYLEGRAEKAAQEYHHVMSNPLDRGNMKCELLQKQWRDAEDLSYILTIAEDVSATVRAELRAS